jgi:predicted TIM-barrel fold metal-dependent hydrolase
MIDMHAHWRPAGLLQSLRQRSNIPQIVHNDQGVEVFRTRFGDESLADAFDNAKDYLARMDAHDVSVSVLSLLSSFCWIQGEAVEQSSALCRTYNESMSQLCLENPGRFACFATVPMRDLKVGAKELDAALKLPGMVGVQVPGNAFMSLTSAEAMRPILEVLNRHKAILFVHYGPMPGDPFPRIPKGSDNFRRRNGTLDMQASLSSIMVTFCMTELLQDYPDVSVQVHNLGGNIPFEIERMDHRCLIDSPEEELPSERFRKSHVLLDCNSFGAHAIEAAVRLYGVERILCGTDGSTFGYEWTTNAVKKSQISDAEKTQILDGNARRLLASITPLIH